MGVGYPPDALPDAPLGVRARISRARALWVLGGEALSVRATSWGAHSGVQTLRSVRAPSLSRALAPRPVATSIVFELVRATLCFVSLASNALVLQEISFQYDSEVSGAIQALWQQQDPAPQQRFASPV